jgi:hypothetical protein
MRSRILAAALLAGIVAASDGFAPSPAIAAPRAESALASEAATRATAVSAPTIDAPATVAAVADQSVTITATATDPDDGDLLTITAMGAPASLTFGHTPGASPVTATLTGTLGAADVGSYFIDWSVSDGGGTAAATTQLTVSPNSDPVVSAPATISGAVGVLTTFAVSASDPDGDEINSLSATGLPAGASFVPNALNLAGQFSWNPSAGSEGTYTVTFHVSSGSPARVASTATTLVIGDLDRPPAIAGAPGTVNGVTSVLIALSPTVTDPDGDTINSFICRGTQNTPLPAGATFVPGPGNTTGAFRWTPTPAQAGTVSVDFIATSGPLNLTAVAISKIVVRVDRAPTVMAPAAVPGSEGSPIAFSVTAADADATPIFSLSASGLPTGASFAPNGTNTSGAFAWTPDYSQAGSHPIVFTAANALSGSAATTITVANVDRAPVVAAPASVAGMEGTPIQFTVGATDPDGDAISTLTALGLPPGATFDADPGNNAGSFHWTPGFGEEGNYSVTFRAANAQIATAITSISVANVNRAPVANDGGPYSGVAGVPVAFDGGASGDPDGDALEYEWSFGDGGSATGVAPTHTYASGGVYDVTLTVTDSGTPALSDEAGTTAEITSVFATRLFTSGGGNKVIRLSSGKPQWCLQLEAAGSSFALSEVLIPSIRLHHGANEISAFAGKSAFSGDTDNNGVSELGLCFSKADLRTLFAGLPSGRNTVTLQLSGALSGGGLLAGTIAVDVFGSGGSLAASVSPNPLNPQATLSLVTTKPGAIRVTLYDASGRFVRTLERRANAPAGTHDIRIDGRDGRGNRLATGVYFYRAETPEGAASGRFTILK